MVLGARANKRILVHTTPKAGSQTIEGVLVRKRPEFILELADLITGRDEKGKEEKVQLEGRVHLLREQIAFWQVLR